MELQGTIQTVLPKESGISQSSNKEWVKNQFVIETKEQYPKKICFQYWKDDVPLLIGSEVSVAFSIESREYNERWYTEAKAFIIKILSTPDMGVDNAEANFENQKPKNQNTQTASSPIDLAEDEGDSLPF